MKTILRPLFELVRVFLTPTAIADSYAGFVLASSLRGVDSEHRTLVALAGCSVLAYWFGMAANDLFDRRKDQVVSPQRPLPSGRITPTATVIFCLTLAAGALALGSWLSILAMVIVLLTLVLLYDVGGKNVPVVGNLLMGACRASNFLLGAAAAFGSAFGFVESPLLLWPAGILGVYIAGVTAISVLEDRPLRSQQFVLTAGSLLIVPIVFVIVAPNNVVNWANSLALGILLLVAIRQGCQALHSEPGRGPHGAAIFVRQALGGIFFVDAGCLLAFCPSDTARTHGALVLYALCAVAWFWKRRWIRAGAMGS